MAQPADAASARIRSGPSRRAFLTAGLAGAGGAAAGVVVGRATASSPAGTPATAVGQTVVPFHGRHQAGIDTPSQAAAAFLAVDLHRSVDREALRRLLRLWSDDAARLSQGTAALADTEPELAETPARLTVTVGFGPRVLDLIGLPHGDRAGVAPLPEFSVDALEDRWSGGDLLLQVCADDRLAVAHAVRVLTKETPTFGRLRWRQDGFQRHAGVAPPGTTPRNLMGQLDGTVNPQTPTDYDTVVWIPAGPAAGGSTLVLRRIRMDLDRWDLLARRERDLVIGRRQSDGAPLTGDTETDVPDLEATDANGMLVIPEFAHVRRARPTTDLGTPRIRRRPYSYQADDGQSTESGLLFASYQADVDRQFRPIQRSLAELDLLNQWTTPIGSAVFLLPPGCRPGGYLGDGLV